MPLEEDQSLLARFKLGTAKEHDVALCFRQLALKLFKSLPNKPGRKEVIRKLITLRTLALKVNRDDA